MIIFFNNEINLIGEDNKRGLAEEISFCANSFF